MDIYTYPHQSTPIYTKSFLPFKSTDAFPSPGFNAGQLQKLQKELCQWAGMAKVVATYAQWWQMEIVMNNLAEEANAGVRLELLPLMKVMGSSATVLHGSSSILVPTT